MNKKEIDEELTGLINSLVKAAGGEIIRRLLVNKLRKQKLKFGRIPKGRGTLFI